MITKEVKILIIIAICLSIISISLGLYWRTKGNDILEAYGEESEEYEEIEGEHKRGANICIPAPLILFPIFLVFAYFINKAILNHKRLKGRVERMERMVMRQMLQDETEK